MKNRKIVPVTICCGKIYADFASISIRSFTKHHSEKLLVLADVLSEKVLLSSGIKNIEILNIEKYERMAKNALNIKEKFISKEAGGLPNGQHMQYLALKPVIMNYAVLDIDPLTDYILSIDVDSYFSGNIITPTHKYLNANKDRFDVYLVSREDKRMHVTCNGPLEIGTGYHLWKIKSNFIKMFIKRFPKRNYTCIGNQRIINMLIKETNSYVFKDPMLHFVSPDLRNPNISDNEIKEIKPAYIHLHGPNVLNRIKKFRKVFEGI